MGTTFGDEEEQALRIELMRADLDLKRADYVNKFADTDYKRGLLRYDFWKVVLGAFTAGAAFMGAIAGILTVLLRTHG